MNVKKAKVISGIFLICFVCILGAGLIISRQENKTKQANTIILKDNMKISAATFLNDFQERYPKSYICKIRWQFVPDDSSITYIIEGIENKMKYIIKYHKPTNSENEDFTVLGVVERELSEAEKLKSTPLEKKVNPEEYISDLTIQKIAKDNCDSPLQEWKIIWKDGKEYLQLTAWGEKTVVEFLIIDPRTGKILMKY